VLLRHIATMASGFRRLGLPHGHAQGGDRALDLDMLDRSGTPLIFHAGARASPASRSRTSGTSGENALRSAGLPSGRLFHDLRRSAVRTLIRPAVDETTAMKVSGHKTRSMLLRYNIVTERERPTRCCARRLSLDAADAGRKRKGTVEGHPRRRQRKSLTDQGGLAPQVGFEPTTLRLTADALPLSY